MVFLSALVVFLPLYEATKNILCVLYLAAWVSARWRSGDWGGPWRAWDAIFAAWIASGFLIAPLAALPGTPWLDAVDLPRMGLVAWAVARARYTEEERARLVAYFIGATVFACLAAGFVVATRPDREFELHSVGQTNQSAIYLAIACGACVSLLLARWRRGAPRMRLALGLALVVLAAALVATASRGALAATLALVMLLGLALRRRSPRALLAVVLGAAALAVLLIAADTDVVRKQARNMAGNNVLAYRGNIWAAAQSAFRAHPLFGVGMGNYGKITLERLRAWEAGRAGPFDASAYLTTNHGHSLYFNTLAERGLAGGVPVAILLAAWGALLWRTRTTAEASDGEAALWGASFAAWFAVVAIGFVNTTLHHEHGLAAVLLLGLHLGGFLAPARAPPGEGAP